MANELNLNIIKLKLKIFDSVARIYKNIEMAGRDV